MNAHKGSWSGARFEVRGKERLIALIGDANSGAVDSARPIEIRYADEHAEVIPVRRTKPRPKRRIIHHPETKSDITPLRL